MSEPQSTQYVILEGVVSGLGTSGPAVVFALAGRQLNAASASAARLLKTGDYVRALVRLAGDGVSCPVLALQWRSETEIHYTGERVSVPVMIIAGLLIIAGVYGRIWWLIFGTFPFVLIRLLFAMREADAIRRFEAYCRTSPTGTLRS
jgi:hypothetical protein